MNRLSFLPVVLVIYLAFLLGCKESAPKEDEMLAARIGEMQKMLSQGPDAALADSLIALSKQWASLQPNDSMRQAESKLHIFSALYESQRLDAAADQLRQLLRHYYHTPQAPEAAVLLARMYKTNLKSPATAFTIYQWIPEVFPQSDKVAEAKSWVPANLLSVTQRIDSMANHVVNAKTGQLDTRMAQDYILSCEMSALLSPKSADAATWLYKAGEVSRALGQNEKALDYYQQAYTTFPNHQRAGEALFMHAFTLDNDLKRYDEAKVLYESFLKKYPEDDFADDAQFLLKNLGKSEEEIFKALEEQVQ